MPLEAPARYDETDVLKHLRALGLRPGDTAIPLVAMGSHLGRTRERMKTIYKRLCAKGYLKYENTQYLIVTYGSLEKNP